LNEKGIIKEFGLVVYPMNFIVVIGHVEKELNNGYAPNENDKNWISGPSPGKACTTYLIHDSCTNQMSVMVWIRNLDECKSSIFAHECSHAAMEIFNYIGATVDLENQEPFAYLIGNLVRLLNGAFYELRDYKPKNKSKKK
jgi:hypothetical protein